MSDGLPASLNEIIDAALRGLQGRLFTGVPAYVKSYDPVKNWIDAEIVVQQAYFNRLGDREYEKFPLLPNVPVIWPRAGGKVLRMKLAVGDSVWLMFSQASLAEWRTTGQVSEPIDSRRHSIGYAYAVPGAFPDTKPLNPVDAAHIEQDQAVFGEDGGNHVRVGPTGVELAPAGVTPIAPVALSPATVAALEALATAIGAVQAEVMAIAANPALGIITPAVSNAVAQGIISTGVTAVGTTLSGAMSTASTAIPSTIAKAT